MAGKQPKVIVFDTFGTVVDWRGSLIADLTKFGETRGVAADWPALVDAWRASYHPSMDRVRKGELPWTKLDGLHRASLDQLVAKFGIKGLSEADLVHINLGWHRLHGWPDSVPGLTRLKKRFPIATLSNGNLSLLVDMARHGGLPWDCVLSAELFRKYKPDPGVYLGAADLLGVAPGELLMVAAHPSDLAAARAAGLRTAYVERPLERGFDGTRASTEGHRFDWTARDFVDLAGQLGA